MTPVILLDRLAEFVEEVTKNIVLQVRVDRNSKENKERPPHVYKMQLPKKDDGIQKVPYLSLIHIYVEPYHQKQYGNGNFQKASTSMRTRKTQ